MPAPGEALRVAIAVPYFSRVKFGGAELWCRHVALGLRGLGHEVRVVTTDLTRHGSVFEPKAPRRDAPWGIPVRRHRVSLLLGLAAKPRGFLPVAPTLPLDPAFAWADVVLVSGVEDPTAALAVLGARLRGKPVVATPFTHADLIRGYTLYGRLLLAVVEAGAGCYLQPLTEVERPFWEARVQARRILAPVGCGVGEPPPGAREDKAAARRALRLPEDEGVVLFLGRLHWSKGVLRAIAAAEGLRRARLHLVGFEEPHPAWRRGRRVRLREYVRQRWPEARSVLVGAVDERVKHRWLAACDVLVLPSHHESFGIALLEAWQHGKPVVAWATGGMAAVVHEGVDGYLVDSIEDLRDRVATLLGKPDLARALGEAGRSAVEQHHRWPAVAARVEANLREALRREAERRRGEDTSPEILEVEP